MEFSISLKNEDIDPSSKNNNLTYLCLGLLYTGPTKLFKVSFFLINWGFLRFIEKWRWFWSLLKSIKWRSEILKILCTSIIGNSLSYLYIIQEIFSVWKFLSFATPCVPYSRITNQLFICLIKFVTQSVLPHMCYFVS